MNEVVLVNREGKTYRVGDYVYLYDRETDCFLANLWSEEKLSRPTSCCDGPYYPLGGGREPGESSIDCLIREVREETDGRLILAPNEPLFIMQLHLLAQKSWCYEDGVSMDGKEMNLYLAFADSRSLPRFSNEEVDGSLWEYDWYPREKVLNTNCHFNSAFWETAVWETETRETFRLNYPR